MRSFCIFLCLICWAGSSYASISTGKLDADLRYLENHLDAYPPQVKNQAQLRQVKAVYARTEKILLNMDKQSVKDAALKTKIGNLYRLGYNLDRKDAWAKSENYFKQAIAIDPSAYEAYYLLGCLYMNSDVALAPQAEKYFLQVRDKATGPLRDKALWGLCVTSWIQGNNRRTLELTTEYLKLHPHDKAALKMHRMAEAGVKSIRK